MTLKMESLTPQNEVGSGTFDLPGSIHYFCVAKPGISVYLEKFLPLERTVTTLC